MSEFHYMLRQRRRRFRRLKNFSREEITVTTIGILVAQLLMVGTLR